MSFLQHLYATVWYVNAFGDMTMKSLYDKDSCDALIASLRQKGKSFRIEYEDA